MAQSTVHVAVGVAAGTLLALPAVWRAWRQRGRLARPIGRGLILAYGLGLFAVLPAILQRLGAGGAWTGAWWATIFIGFPLLRRLGLPSIVLGELLLALLFGLHYGVILLAIRRTGGGHPENAGAA